MLVFERDRFVLTLLMAIRLVVSAGQEVFDPRINKALSSFGQIVWDVKCLSKGRPLMGRKLGWNLSPTAVIIVDSCPSPDSAFYLHLLKIIIVFYLLTEKYITCFIFKTLNNNKLCTSNIMKCDLNSLYEII